jgi:hypothetical protein
MNENAAVNDLTPPGSKGGGGGGGGLKYFDCQILVAY